MITKQTLETILYKVENHELSADDAFDAISPVLDQWVELKQQVFKLTNAITNISHSPSQYDH